MSNREKLPTTKEMARTALINLYAKKGNENLIFVEIKFLLILM